MTTERILPADPLKPFVKAYMLIESQTGMTNTILPSTSVVIAFRYKGQLSSMEGDREMVLPGAAITGLRNASRLINYSHEAGTLLVIFQEGGASALFAEPIHELFGASLSLDRLINPQTVQDVEEQLAEAITNQQRVAIVEQFLLSRMKRNTGDKLVYEAVHRIQISNGSARIKDLLTDLPISRDPFEKRFRRVIGTSPKQFSEIVRFRHIVSLYSPVRSLTDIAYSTGYFDQAHFIRDFKAFTGQVPHLFFKAGRYW